MTLLSITTPTLTNPADKTELENNFNDVVSWANGSISNNNVAASAAISIDKLDAQYQEVWVNLVYSFGDQGAWPAVGATTPLALVALPGSDSDTAWVATDVSWVCTDTGVGATPGSFDVRYGAYNGAGAWTNAGSIVAGASLPVVGAGNLGNQGRALENGSVSITQSTTIRALALMSGGNNGGTVMDAAGGRLSVSVALKRKIIA